MGQWQAGYRGRIYLVESVADVAGLVLGQPQNVAYVTQTTLSVDDTHAIVAALRARFPHIEGPRKDDICYATQNRQDAVRALAAQVDLVLVVGSASSSNSNRLRELAEKQGVPSYLIDGPESIDPTWLAGKPRVGLTAGASAPEQLVRAVIEHLQSVGASVVHELSGAAETITFALPRELRA